MSEAQKILGKEEIYENLAILEDMRKEELESIYYSTLICFTLVGFLYAFVYACKYMPQWLIKLLS